jgi:hypothetical protein
MAIIGFRTVHAYGLIIGELKPKKDWRDRMMRTFGARTLLQVASIMAVIFSIIFLA